MPRPESTTDDQVLHVMFDADGVIQDIPGGWHAVMRPFLGERTDEFLHRAWADELPALTDEIDYLPVLERALRDYRVEDARNVEGATEAGLRAERWQLSDGHDRLRATLRSHGIKIPAG
jgi:hypothetical protein